MEAWWKIRHLSGVAGPRCAKGSGEVRDEWGVVGRGAPRRTFGLVPMLLKADTPASTETSGATIPIRSPPEIGREDCGQAFVGLRSLNVHRPVDAGKGMLFLQPARGKTGAGCAKEFPGRATRQKARLNGTL